MSSACHTCLSPSAGSQAAAGWRRWCPRAGLCVTHAFEPRKRRRPVQARTSIHFTLPVVTPTKQPRKTRAPLCVFQSSSLYDIFRVGSSSALMKPSHKQATEHSHMSFVSELPNAPKSGWTAETSSQRDSKRSHRRAASAGSPDMRSTNRSYRQITVEPVISPCLLPSVAEPAEDPFLAA